VLQFNLPLLFPFHLTITRPVSDIGGTAVCTLLGAEQTEKRFAVYM